VRAPVPLDFPEEALMPESKTHLTLRTFLYQLLQFALGPSESVGSEQFVYFNAANPKKCLAPDVFVKRGVPDAQFGTWKTWERGGPPELAVEIVSPTEDAGRDWDEKLAAYFECGVSELVRFDPAAPEGARLRAWDRVEDDLVERIVVNDRTPCATLSLGWVVAPVASPRRRGWTPRAERSRGRGARAGGRGAGARGGGLCAGGGGAGARGRGGAGAGARRGAASAARRLSHPRLADAQRPTHTREA
jgi:Uma2 family endonuclease